MTEPVRSEERRGVKFVDEVGGEMTSRDLRKIEHRMREHLQERFWRDFEAAQQDMAVADNAVSGPANTSLIRCSSGQQRPFLFCSPCSPCTIANMPCPQYQSQNGPRAIKSRREMERAERGKARMSFWEQQREEEEKKKQAAEAKKNEGAIATDLSGTEKKKRGQVSSNAIYSFDKRSNWAEQVEIRKADLRDALDLCRYQIARNADPRIVEGSVRRAEHCFQVLKGTPKREVWGRGGNAEYLVEASQRIQRFKLTLQRLRDGGSATACPQDPALPSTHDPPRPSTPPLTSAGAPVPRPRTPPLSTQGPAHTGPDFPPYVEPPNAATERARNAKIWRLKNLDVPKSIQKQLERDRFEREQQERKQNSRDYRTVDELPDNRLEYTM